MVEQGQVFFLSADSFSAQVFVKASSEEGRSLMSLKSVCQEESSHGLCSV